MSDLRAWAFLVVALAACSSAGSGSSSSSGSHAASSSGTGATSATSTSASSGQGGATSSTAATTATSVSASSSGPTSTSSTAAASTSSSASSSTSASASSSSGGPACNASNAVYTTTDPQGQWGDGTYFVRNDAWNNDAGPQTLYVCSHESWSVVANESSTTDVKSYPDVQMDFQQSGAATGSGVPISSFHSITSTFAETSPHVGIYEDAFDIFVNSTSLVGPGTTEIMIWVDNEKQVPAGNKLSSAVTIDNRPWDVWYEADNGNGGHYIAFVAGANFSSGTVDVLAFFQYVIAQGWIPKDAPLNQVCFGVEICETNGADATFEFSSFSITTT